MLGAPGTYAWRGMQLSDYNTNAHAHALYIYDLSFQ